jgi:hypothetical protein
MGALFNPSRKFSGKPCKRCDGTLRYISTRNCVACNLAKYDRHKQGAHQSGAIKAAQNRSANLRTRQLHSIDTESRYCGFPDGLKYMEYDEMISTIRTRVTEAMGRAR